MKTQYSLIGPLFLAAMGQLTLCLSQHLCHSGRKRRVFDGVLFLALLTLCAWYQTEAMEETSFSAILRIAVPAVLTLAFIHVAAGIFREYRESRETLTPASVKQALDNLGSGILFADETGRAVLVNRAMARLSYMLIGSYPQTLSELEAALSEPGRGVEKIEGVPLLYRFPEGHIWRFRTVPLTDPELPGFTQTTAEDMTELFETNVRLERDNAALRSAIAKMLDMTRRLTDLIPKQETLNLKIRIHDEIGASLIALSGLAKDGSQEDTDAQLRKLERALVPFGSERAVTPGTFESAQRQAAEMNVTLQFDGFVPSNEDMERLIATAALECVTNCVQHARGTHVWVKIAQQEGIYTVIITNDGSVPKAPVTEGGGLSSLRRNVERAGGEMCLSHIPRFTLILHLPERRPEI